MPDQQKYTQKLSGARVLVIGGSSGIGFCVAESALEYGAHVSISSSNPTRIDNALSRLKTAYPSKASSHLAGYPCDVSDDTNMESNVTTLLDKATDNGKNKLDHIIYTAGSPITTTKLEEIAIPKIKAGANVRFFGAMLIGKHGPKYMNPGPKSSITLTTGSVSERPQPGWVITASFATGMQGLTRGLALELAPLRVNLISPGAVETELWDTLDAQMRAGIMKHLAEKMPTKTIAKPEDVAEAYLYVMKDTNITGSMISTNGGQLLV